MIQRARFQNFKSLRDVEVTFDSRLTVLVGPNGSGKTSVLEGLQFTLNLMRPATGAGPYELSSLPGYASAWASWEDMRLEASGQRSQATYKVELGQPDSHNWQGSLTISAEGKQTAHKFYGQRSGGGVGGVYYNSGEFSRDEAAVLDRAAVLRLSPSRLPKPTLTPAAKYPPTMGGDGTGLAATLVYMQRKYPDRFEAVVAAFCDVIPGVRGIRFDEAPAEGGQFLAPIILADFVGATGIPAHHLSSGTLFALGLLTAALGPDSPNVLLVDELDHGLHPKAQAELIGVFQRLVETNPELQIIGTTHSLYILHHLQVGQIRLMNILPDGSATCGRLDNHPEYERWRKRMTPGEFWGHVGEDWLLKPATSPAA